MARFDNKVVLVSGGARGQGAAEARLLVAQGAKSVIGDVLDNADAPPRDARGGCAAVAFLLSDESSYITGAEIAIDGASSAWLADPGL
jgi:NAD(P)-dependent dehydrogenase (short-subunit alcohol dehydrogenase family)